MKLAIRHTLAFRPAADAAYAVQHLLVTPRDGPTQKVHDWSVGMDGIGDAPAFIDAYGNRARLTGQLRPGGRIEVRIAGTVETLRGDGVVGAPPDEPVPALFRRVTPQTRVPVALYARFRHAERGDAGRLELAHALMAHLHETLSAEEGEAGARKGAAAFALAFVGCARVLDMPARYVTGYLAEAPEGFEALAPAVHAWAEAQIDGLGWVGFDAMLNQSPTEAYVRVANGLDARSAMALRCHPVAEEAETTALEIVAGEDGPAGQRQSQDGQSQRQG